jgi:signal transduction histidine kinase
VSTGHLTGNNGNRSALGVKARRLRAFLSSLPARYRNCSLAAQFTVAAAVVILITMTILGRWVAARIESGVLTNTAAAAALYMDRFIEPHVQELASRDDLTPASRQALAELVKTRGFKRHIAAIKIWRPDGTIVYSDRDSLIGVRLPLSDSLKKAVTGTIVPEFDHLDDEENEAERGLGLPLLEIYAPLRQAETDRIIAVAELYQVAGGLEQELSWARLESVIIVSGLALVMLGTLAGIVGRGSQTIVQQQQALNARIGDLSQSLAVNKELRERLADANRRVTESGEQFLRRVSAELHDGPVQLLGLVLLRLDDVSAEAHDKDPARGGETLTIIRGALRDALSEIRGLANGFALPELESLKLTDALELAINNHQRRSGTTVSVSFPPELPCTPISVKTCAYRFVQEGLNNAFRHAGGAGQHVAVAWDGVRLEISVSDKGPGLPQGASGTLKGGIGLSGMRDRIESLGGTMIVEAAEGQGARLRASFYLGGC